MNHFRTFYLLSLFLLTFGSWSCTNNYSLSPQTSSSNNSNSASNNSSWVEATSAAAFSDRGGQSSVSFNNNLWVIGGESTSSLLNDVWESGNGSTWTEATSNAAFGQRELHSSVVFNGYMWVIGGEELSTGFSADSWYSSDGVNWNEATANGGFTGRCEFGSAVLNNKIWIAGGFYYSGSYNYLNDVWSSSNGSTWTQATSSAAFTQRGGIGFLSYNNQLWVFGGYEYYGSYTFYSDVWHSSDGVNWTQATANAAFGPIALPYCLVYNNEMWVMGGVSSAGSSGIIETNTCWHSTDGVNWIQQTASTTFSARYGGSEAIYDNSMWVIGGITNYPAFDNAVWHNP